jgi:hypothetical protein
MTISLDEAIEILQAAKNGKDIEISRHKDDNWVRKLPELPFNFDHYKYRVSKKPKTLHQFLARDANGAYVTIYKWCSSQRECQKMFPDMIILHPVLSTIVGEE